PPLPEIDKSPMPITQETTEIKGETEDYTVSKGDTLWGISKKFYGEGSKWQLILNANKDIISDPNKLKAGTVIKIPQKP
ncbi:MAG TPA: LysM peptidoglycan-binding domain-containing protein, partial [Victivallales bacterium]|nr:LysM peptidoglycan-binding domain-containing protein [Victivallales bacterium]